MTRLHDARRSIAAIAAVMMMLPIASFADTIRVPGDEPTIQAGIDAAVNGDVVLIADGVYTGPDNKNLDFGGKAITVRGENGRDACIIDCEDDGRAFYFHSGEGADSVVKDLTIRNGLVRADAPFGRYGAGILCLNSSPMIMDCRMLACFANEGNGGGVYCENGDAVIRGCIFDDCFAFPGGGGVELRNSSATVQSCTFENCTALDGGGLVIIDGSPLVKDCAFIGNTGSGAGNGSAIFCFAGPIPPRIIGCDFEGNSGRSALVARGGVLLVKGCVFTGNRADYSPAFDDDTTGGTWVDRCRFISNVAGIGDGAVSCSPNTVLMNCEFYLNRTRVGSGGAISVRNGTLVQNCTFVGNTAGKPVGGAVRASGSASTFWNCIFWDNELPWVSFSGAAPLVSYSIVQDGWPGEGNIDLDPRFADQPNGDLHLLADSPAIDAGNAAFVAMPGETDIDGQARVWNGRVDIGSDEFGSFAFGDVNCNGNFDAFDVEPFLLALFDPDEYAVRFPDCEPNLGDINGDGSVNAFDIEPFLELLFP